VQSESSSIHAVGSQTGLLLSGGLDSAILLGQLLSEGHRVQPFYVLTGCVWQECELRAVREFCAALAQPNLAELVLLDMPVDDLYDDHWSISGRSVPDLHSPDEAVFMLGRNPLLLLKPVLWCQMHGISQLALATVATNPFEDATPAFFASFEAMVREATGGAVSILRPFERLSKRCVMLRGRALPLELTFSCLAPIDGLHCGRCNKCAERIAAFGHLKSVDVSCDVSSPVLAAPVAAGTPGADRRWPIAARPAAALPCKLHQALAKPGAR
jgi:7-cyano-7-deazaguanine synthase